jgi:hypothetical protein
MDKDYELMNDGKMRLTARNLQGDHYAIVTRGACSPEQGCGIGLSASDNNSIISTNIGYYQNGTITIFNDDKKWDVDKEIKDKLKIEIEIEKEKLKGGK